MVLQDIIALAVLLVLSGFFSGIEIAFFSISNIRVRHLLEKEVPGSATLSKLKSDPHRLLITILIGNNLVNIGASALATVLAVNYFGSKGAGIAVGVMTFLILVFGEITPKSFANIHAESIALFIAKPIYWLQLLFMPITFFLDKFIKILTKIVGGKEYNSGKITEEELRSIVNISHEAGGIGKDEKEMIHKIFEFDDIEVKEIMIPRTDVEMLDISTTIPVLCEFLKNKKFTRIPVYEDNPDNIKGILYIKDIIPDICSLGSKVSLRGLLKPVMFVPGTKKIDSLLREFQRKKRHIAIVVDEHGNVLGIITLEDIIEEIVGEIYDENEERKDPIKIVNDHTAIVDSETNLEKLNEKLRLGFQRNKKKTIGAFVLEKLGRIPSKGNKLVFASFEIIVDKVEENRIISLKIIKKKGKIA
ncbi:hemolysin family protein [Thermoproteota archaeon]